MITNTNQCFMVQTHMQPVHTRLCAPHTPSVRLLCVCCSPEAIPSHFSLRGQTHSYSSIPEKVKPARTLGFMGHGEKLVVCLHNRKAHTGQLDVYPRPPILALLIPGWSSQWLWKFFSICHMLGIVFFILCK